MDKVNKIKLDDLIFKHCKQKMDLKNFIKIKDYISYVDKMKYIDEFCEDIIKIDNGVITYNSVEKYAKGILLILSIYTNIEFDMSFDSFDLFEKNYLTEEILVMIPEYSTFKTFLDARFQDHLRDYVEKLNK